MLTARPTEGKLMPAHVDGIGHHHNQRSSRIRLLPAVLVLLAIAGLPCVTLAQDAAPAPLLSADVFKSFYRPDVTVRYRLNLPEDQLAERRLVRRSGLRAAQTYWR